jgi:hypothetical protein
MVCIMVGHQQQLPQVRLVCAGRNLPGEVYTGIQSEPLQLVSVSTECSDTLIPRVGRRRGGGFGPVVVRPAAFLVLRVDAKMQDVFLGDAEVLQQLPGRVGKTCGYLPPKIGRESGDNLVEVDVRVSPVEQTGNARADLRVLLRSRSPCPRTPLAEAQARLHARPAR